MKANWQASDRSSEAVSRRRETTRKSNCWGAPTSVQIVEIETAEEYAVAVVDLTEESSGEMEKRITDGLGVLEILEQLQQCVKGLGKRGTTA